MRKFMIWVIYLIVAQIGILAFNTKIGLDAFTATYLHAVSFVPFFMWVIHDMGQPLATNHPKDEGEAK